MIRFDQLVIVKLDRQQQLAQKDPRAILSRDHAGVLSDPSKPGANRPRLVHDRGRVDADSPLDSRNLLRYPAEKLLQLVPQYFVIVVTPGIARDLANLRVIDVLLWLIVVQRDTDNRARRRHQPSRVGSHFRIATQIAHLSVKIGRQPLA